MKIKFDHCCIVIIVIVFIIIIFVAPTKVNILIIHCHHINKNTSSNVSSDQCEASSND